MIYYKHQNCDFETGAKFKAEKEEYDNRISNGRRSVR